MFRRYLPLIVLFLSLVLIGGYSFWDASQPESSGPFEVVGEFVGARNSGTLVVGGGEEHNTTSFELIVTHAEFTRVDTTYTKWLRKGGPIPVKDRPSVFLSRETTGNWCGSLPNEGTRVHIDSPTGYTNDVTVRELDTAVIYRNGNNCARPILTFHFRAMDKTMNVIKKGTVSAHDAGEALSKISDIVLQTFKVDTFNTQLWQDGEIAPTPPTPK